MTTREFLRELFRRSARGKSLTYREMWRRHPAFCALYAAVAIGLTTLSGMNLEDSGGSHLQRGLYLAAWIAWIALLVIGVRRIEPPSEQ
jgi:hypothetical protein